MKIQHAALVAVMTLGLGLAACQKKEEGPVEKAVDAVGDATNTRDNESMKDAGENLGEAAENAGDAVKDATN